MAEITNGIHLGAMAAVEALKQCAAKDRRIAELEAEVSDFDCEMTIIAQAITAAFEDGRLSPADKANLQLADIAESKKWTTEETDKMRERIAELEAQVSGHPEAIAAAKREALEEASDWFAGQADDPASRDYWKPDDLACELRRMAREVKP